MTTATRKYKQGNRVRYNGVICAVSSLASDGRLNIHPIVGNWKATVEAAEVEPVGSMAHSFAPPPEYTPDDEPARYIDADIEPDTAEVLRVEVPGAAPPVDEPELSEPQEVEVPTNVDPETGEYLDRGASEPMPHSLVKLDDARRFLAEARAVDDVKALRDKAEAMRVYAQQAKLGLEAQNYAAEIKLRAERRAGELLLELPKNTGTKGQLVSRGVIGGQVTQPPINDNPTLSEFGISKYQSSAWQQIASIPADVFESQIEACRDAGDELTTIALVREARKLSSEARREEKRKRAQSLPEGVFNVIYADPPWKYDNTGVHGAATSHYETMTSEEIYDLPRRLGLCIDDNAILFLWVTNAFLVEGIECIRHWGFEYKSNVVWVKTELVKPGSGWYLRGRHELLLIATRGSFTPLDEHISPPIGSVVEAPIREHSRKPDVLYEVIERLYPNCHYLELFARRSRGGWSSWGDEVDE